MRRSITKYIQNNLQHMNESQLISLDLENDVSSRNLLSQRKAKDERVLSYEAKLKKAV
jgi:hypothetical protein